MLLPRPAHILPGDGQFPLSGATPVTAAAELAPEAHRLRTALPPGPPDAPGSVTLSLAADLGPEAYRLTVTPHGITVEGGDRAGVFYGCQSLLQLLPPAVHRKAHPDGAHWTVPAVTIEDRPRFGWRGAMLDVARHFMPKHDVLRFLDLMALHKLNTLHFHITDDQGWRVEILRHPKLTEVGSWRRETQLGAQDATSPGDGRPHGGFYTQDDIREIVAYAAALHIAVVPEVDVPGHSQAAIAAYPRLGVTGEQLEVWTRFGVTLHVLNAEESTVAFFCDVFDEIMDLFPGEFIGIGGDECPKQQWKDDPRTQQLIRDRGLRGEQQLQAWFIGRLGAHITARGRRPLGWDDILEGDIPHGTAVWSWRGMTGAVTAARRGFDVVSCPDHQTYLDYRQSELPGEPIPVNAPLTLEDAYAFDPVPPELTPDEAARVLGGQANIWTEHMDSPRTVDYFAFPRLCATAEALWSSADRDFAAFSRRLDAHLPRLDAFGVEYRRPEGPRPWQTRPGVDGRPATRDEWAQLIDSLVAHIRT